MNTIVSETVNKMAENGFDMRTVNESVSDCYDSGFANGFLTGGTICMKFGVGIGAIGTLAAVGICKLVKHITAKY